MERSYRAGSGWPVRTQAIAHLQQSEAIVLRSWPFQEADLLVSLFTREQGIVRGVARHAMRSRRRFGGALEPATQVRATWKEKPKQDLVHWESFDILWSPLRQPVDYIRAAGLALVAEVLESALPDRAPEDDVYRLALAAITRMEFGSVWLPVTYFSLWLTRLLGWMPDLRTCAVCNTPLRGKPVYTSPLRDGVTDAEHRGRDSNPLSFEAVAMAERVFRHPITAFAAEEWPRTRVPDLRRFALSTLERHLEERLSSARVLNRL